MLIARKNARFSTYLYLSESSPVIQTQNKPQFNALCFKYSNNPNSIGPNTRSLAVLNYISSVSWDSAVKSVVLHFSNEQSDSNIQFVCKTLSTKQILSKSLLLKWKQTKTHLLSWMWVTADKHDKTRWARLLILHHWFHWERQGCLQQHQRQRAVACCWVDDVNKQPEGVKVDAAVLVQESGPHTSIWAWWKRVEHLFLTVFHNDFVTPNWACDSSTIFLSVDKDPLFNACECYDN